MKIYYAHHMWKYDTEIEKYELGLIKTKYPDAIIINPNEDLNFTGLSTEEEIMNICFNAIRDCNILVFSSISGVVGKGVADEVTLARELKMPIFYIENNTLNTSEDIRFKVIPDSKTKRIYANISRL